MKASKAKLLSVAVGTFCMMLCNGIVLNSTTYFTLSVTEYLNCSVAAFSVYFTIVTACTAIASPIVGSVVRKIGVRKCTLIAFVLGTAGFLILSRVEYLWMVYLGAMCVGTAQTFVVIPVVGVINSWFTKNASTVTGITMSAVGFCGLMMSVVMPYSVENFSWRTGYLICAGLWILFSLTAFAFAGGTPPAAERLEGDSGKQAKGEKGGGYWDTLRKPTFWVLMLTALCSSGATMINQHMTVHLTARGMGMGMISFVIGGMSLALSFFKIAEGALCDRIPEKIFMPLAFFSGAVGYIALSGSSVPMLLLGVVCYGSGAACCVVLYPVVLRRLYGRENATAVWGICWAAFMVGQALWTPMYASIYDSTGEYTLGLYAAAIVIALCALFVNIQLAKQRKAEQADSQKNSNAKAHVC